MNRPHEIYDVVIYFNNLKRVNKPEFVPDAFFGSGQNLHRPKIALDKIFS